MDFEVAANDDLLTIDVGGGEQSKSTRVTFASHDGERLYLWERLDVQRWQRIEDVDLINRVEAANPGAVNLDVVFFQGEFQTADLRPGQTYCLRAYVDESADPNDPARDQVWEEVCVIALRRDVETSVPLDTYRLDAGGTWVSVYALSAGPRIGWTVEIGTGMPIVGSNGLQRLQDPLARVADARLTASHFVELTDGLYAGNHYNILTRIIDADGNWEERVDHVVTLQRTVHVALQKLYIVNDGDPLGAGAASFVLEVYEGHSPFASWAFGGNDFEIVTSGAIDLPPYETTIGPTSLSDRNWEIGIKISGVEDDSPLRDEYAASSLSSPSGMFGPDTLAFPVGSWFETVTSARFIVHAQPLTVGDDFAFDVEGRYSVSYA